VPYVKKKTLLREDYVRQYAVQQKEIKKTEEFIRKILQGEIKNGKGTTEAIRSNG